MKTMDRTMDDGLPEQAKLAAELEAARGELARRHADIVALGERFVAASASLIAAEQRAARSDLAHREALQAQAVAKAELDELRAGLKEAHGKLKAEQQRRQRLLRSLSWRVTLPLRWIGRPFGR